MTALERLLGYIELGFALLFWPRLEDPTNDWKGPRDNNWPTKTYRLEDFREGMQVGVKLGAEIAPGRFLLDVDLDWKPGIAFVHRLLPDTGFTFGRPSKPTGHAFYTTSSPVASKKFQDIDGTTLVELRGTKADGSIGMQTMLPPSVHRRSGEMLSMVEEGQPAHRDDVAGKVAHYAAACLLGRHWPSNGPDTNQHDVAGSVAGFLCWRGVDPTIVPTIVEVAAMLGGDDNVEDRVRYARDTVAKFAAGEQRLTGGPSLAREVGERVVVVLNNWFPAADPLQIAFERMNQRFAHVAVGVKVVVMETRPDGGVKALWPPEEFLKFWIKERIDVIVDGKPKRLRLAKLWLEHEQGRRYEQLVYVMPGSVTKLQEGDYNGYLGLAVTPAPGDWSKNKRHVLEIICGGDAKIFDWVLNWMAALVQWPGRHAFAAIVLRGGQGTGKGHFADQMLGALFHKQQYIHIVGASMLTGRFNEHLSGKVLVFADEATWGGDPAAAERLKGLVTESTVGIERKFLPLVEEPSALHIVIASNNEWPISIPLDDRRFLVLDVADTERQNDDYFQPLRKELQNGGLAAMLDELLAYSVDERALRHPPDHQGKTRLGQAEPEADRTVVGREARQRLNTCAVRRRRPHWTQWLGALGIEVRST